MFLCHQNTKGVLSKGIWGVRVCSGCPGEKTKRQKASFHSRKLKKGVRVNSEHKRCSGALLEVLFSNGTQRMFQSHARSISFKMEHKCHQNTKGVLSKGIWGVRMCSGCSGCPGEKTSIKRQVFIVEN